jgi:hypothetical protein
MKKIVSFLSACMFLVASAHAGEKIVVASAAPTQSKAVVVKAKAAAKKSAPMADYALESFGCCGLPQ